MQESGQELQWRPYGMHVHTVALEALRPIILCFLSEVKIRP